MDKKLKEIKSVWTVRLPEEYSVDDAIEKRTGEGMIYQGMDKILPFPFVSDV